VVLRQRNRKAEMPIYEYRATGKGCRYCRDGFEIKQRMDAKPLSKCPKCGVPIRRLVSRFRAVVAETDEEVSAMEKKIRKFERGGGGAMLLNSQIKPDWKTGLKRTTKRLDMKCSGKARF
jgi:putative FmdB family regulatory protein